MEGAFTAVTGRILEKKNFNAENQKYIQAHKKVLHVRISHFVTQTHGADQKKSFISESTSTLLFCGGTLNFDKLTLIREGDFVPLRSPYNLNSRYSAIYAYNKVRKGQKT